MVKLQFWRSREGGVTPSMPLLSGPLWPGEVATVRVPFTGGGELLKLYSIGLGTKKKKKKKNLKKQLQKKNKKKCIYECAMNNASRHKNNLSIKAMKVQMFMLKILVNNFLHIYYPCSLSTKLNFLYILLNVILIHSCSLWKPNSFIFDKNHKSGLPQILLKPNQSWLNCVLVVSLVLYVYKIFYLYENIKFPHD